MSEHKFPPTTIVDSSGRVVTKIICDTEIEPQSHSIPLQSAPYTSALSEISGTASIPVVNAPCQSEKPLGLQIGGKHYKAMKIQPVEYIHANQIPFMEGSIIKYISRWREKGGIQDLQKAKHFIDLLIELEQKCQ